MIDHTGAYVRRGPCREQNLLMSTSKHLYLTKNGFLRRQQKQIDPRLPGTKTLLTRLVVLDVDIGAVYGEMHRADAAPDLLGFLSRAWSIKAAHPMHGIPRHLNAPKAAIVDSTMNRDLHLLTKAGHFTLAPLPAGFAAGAHAVKQFELQIESLLWRAECDVDLEFIHAVSGVISHEASSGMSVINEEVWSTVPAPGDDFNALIDAQYETFGAWRQGSFELVLKGLPAT